MKMPKVLVGICVSPRRSLTVPASEEVVKERWGSRRGSSWRRSNLSGL